MRKAVLGTTWLALLIFGCTTIEEMEQSGPQVTDPQGQYSLDDDLCWQSVQPAAGAPADAASIQAAHDACMREKGWKTPQR